MRGGAVAPGDWGITAERGNTVCVHLLHEHSERIGEAKATEQGSRNFCHLLRRRSRIGRLRDLNDVFVEPHRNQPALCLFAFAVATITDLDRPLGDPS